MRAPASLVLVVFMMMAIVQAAGCGPGQRTQTLKTTLAAVNAARDGFVAWDLQHQRSIVAKATIRAEAEMLLEQYRQNHRVIELAFEGAYRAIATAATEGDEDSLRQALKTADDLRKAIQALMGGGQ